jgi:hypothetical protein
VPSIAPARADIAASNRGFALTLTGIALLVSAGLVWCAGWWRRRREPIVEDDQAWTQAVHSNAPPVRSPTAFEQDPHMAPPLAVEPIAPHESPSQRGDAWERLAEEARRARSASLQPEADPAAQDEDAHTASAPAEPEEWRRQFTDAWQRLAEEASRAQRQIPEPRRADRAGVREAGSFRGQRLGLHHAGTVQEGGERARNLGVAPAHEHRLDLRVLRRQ